MADLYEVYDGVVELQPMLLRRIACGTNPDYRYVKALAACYELQEFLANILPELPEGEGEWVVHE